MTKAPNGILAPTASTFAPYPNLRGDKFYLRSSKPLKPTDFKTGKISHDRNKV